MKAESNLGGLLGKSSRLLSNTLNADLVNLARVMQHLRRGRYPGKNVEKILAYVPTRV